MENRTGRVAIWLLAVVGILAIALTAAGAYLANKQQNYELLAAGLVSLMLVLLAVPVLLQLRAFQSANCAQSDSALSAVSERFEQFSVMLNLISEQQLLSDRAKSVAFREKDSEALRRAIQDEMHRQNWEAALALANEIEVAFGYTQEAERFRTQIEDKRQDLVRKQVSEISATIDRHIRAEDWSAANREAQRAAQMFPRNPQAQQLSRDLEGRRTAQKQQLIESWNDAVARHDVDGGIEILKRLDDYLSPAEGQQFQDAARGMFKEKISTLRTQFSVAVQDHKWAEALRLGETITADFPNTQMAKEVRDMMENLRARATAPATA